MGDFVLTLLAVVLGNFIFHWLIAKMQEVINNYGGYGNDDWDETDDWF